MATSSLPGEPVTSEPNIHPSTAPADAPATPTPETLAPEPASDVASSTQSLSESIREHVYENGRRYHKASWGKYAMPTDDTELDRLDFTHAFYLELLDGKQYLAPLDEDPAHVLDCGTGTGIWALDFGDEHPESKVVGVDLAPIQPNWTAPNVCFELDDLENRWTFDQNHFGFIHSRNIAAGIKNWPRYLTQMYRHATPGGWVEIVEHGLSTFYCDDGTMPADSPFQIYMSAMSKSLENMGVNPHIELEDYRRMLEDAGFVNIQTHSFKTPIGTWPRNRKLRRLGAIISELSNQGFEAYGRGVMTGFGGMGDEEAMRIIAECVRMVKTGEQHIYNQQWHLIAQKPRE
ncbi:methyltransferase domain-containing protein [Ascodesmis nigricans]|uniref:Methyltransferase domain-containing protein n=1 Tax=Ascodesmis nigricans TaxID=341454 RepID=A0A4S2MIQ3_9PEZI|nr:methyltransferase domain-containing protein [Ascodesmis nigricans]